jgi:hypothetical protein
MTALWAVHQLGVAVTADEMTCSNGSCHNSEQPGRRIYGDVVITICTWAMQLQKKYGEEPYKMDF